MAKQYVLNRSIEAAVTSNELTLEEKLALTSIGYYMEMTASMLACHLDSSDRDCSISEAIEVLAELERKGYVTDYEEEVAM